MYAHKHRVIRRANTWVPWILTFSWLLTNEMASGAQAGAAALADIGFQALAGGADIRVQFPKGIEVKDGVEIPKAQAHSEPHVEISSKSSPPPNYTLICVDPDAPSPDDPKMREWLHWLVVNIQNGDMKTGNVLTPYMGPAPPRGVHRYVFLLYEQPAGVNIQAQPISERAKFHAQRWAKQHGLADPVTATYFTSRP